MQKDRIVSLNEKEKEKTLIKNDQEFLKEFLNQKITREDWIRNRHWHQFEEITLASEKIGKLPNDLLREWDMLTSIDMSNNKLEYLPDDLFSKCSQLTTVLFSKNQLSTLPNDLFKICFKLEEVNFSNNKLTKLPQDIFLNNKQLIEVDFYKNRLKKLPKSLFNECKQIERVFFDENQLTKLPNDLFSHCDRLLDVDFSNNQLTQLSNNLFEKCRNLEEANFSFNQLSNIPNGLFKECAVLDWVDFSNNLLTALPNDLFNQCEQITHLLFSNNQLKNLHDNQFKQFTFLQEVNFSFNNITNLPKNLFNECKDLKEVYFSNNQLASLPNDLFENCKQLEEINFSFNQLRIFPNDLIKNCEQIKSLNFSNNKLSFLNYESLVNIQNLDFRNNIDSNNADALFKMFFSNIKIAEKSKQHKRIKKRGLDFEGSTYYLMRSNSQSLRFKVSLLFLNKECFSRVPKNNFAIENSRKFLSHELSLLDLAASIEGITADSLINLKNYIQTILNENKQITNHEFRFFSSASIVELLKKNDNFLFDSFFSFASLEWLISSFEANADENTIEYKNHMANVNDVYIFKKNFREFYLQINYSECFQIALKNNNEQLAIHLLLMMKFIIAYDLNRDENLKLVKIILENKFIKEFSEKLLDEFLKEIFEMKWKRLIKFILDNNQNDKRFLNLNFLKPTSSQTIQQLVFGNTLSIINQYSHTKVVPEETTTLNDKKDEQFVINNERDILYYLSILKDSDLLKHPTTKDLLQERWRLPRYFYYFNLIAYITFLALYSINIEIFDGKQNSSSNETPLENSSRITAFFIILYFFIFEILQMSFAFIQDEIIEYLFSFKNLIEISNSPLCIATLWILSNTYSTFQLKSSLFSASIVLSYFILLFKLDKLSTLGAYVNVFGSILRKSLKLLIIVIICLFGFLLSFRNRARPFSSDDSTDNLMPLFNTTFSMSFITLATMAVGSLGVDGFGIENITNYNIINFLLYILFIFIMPILFVNIFTAISIDEVNKLIDNAEAESVLIKIEYVLKFEAILVKYVVKVYRFFNRIDELIACISQNIESIFSKSNFFITKKLRASHKNYEKKKANETTKNGEADMEQKGRIEMLEKILMKMYQLDSKINQQSNEISKLSNETKKLSFKQTDETNQIYQEIAKINEKLKVFDDDRPFNSKDLLL